MPSSATFDVDPSCGILRYSPNRDGPIKQGWNYTGDYQHTAHQISARQSSLQGAKVEVDWIGTGIQLYGDAQAGAAYQFTIDGGGSLDVVTGKLGTFEGLDFKNHTLSLEIVSSGDSVVTLNRLSLILEDGVNSCV